MKFLKWLFSKKGYQALKDIIKESDCKHEYWYLDKQILVIKCCNCNKKAWIKEIKNLFP